MKFAGNYHGHGDLLLAEAGSGLAALGLPGSAGVTDAAVSDTVVAPYNQVPELDGDTACVIVEPVAANMGLVPPEDGFLKGLRAECDRVGALLVFDEVITGFRVAYGGAQAATGITPDLTTFGKVIGGGLNIGAYGGRRDVMQQVAPLGPVYQAGTLSGNPLATAAGLAALDLLDAAAYATLTAHRRAPGRRPPRRVRRGRHRGGRAAGRQPRRPLLLRRGPGRLRRARSAPTPRATPPSSTPCSTAAWPWRPGAYEVMFPGLAHTGRGRSTRSASPRRRRIARA